MKVGFIGTGRMGQAMVRRLLDAKHEVGIYNRTAEKAKPLAEAGAKIVGSVADAARYGDVIYTMLADDAALEDVVFRQGCSMRCRRAASISAPAPTAFRYPQDQEGPRRQGPGPGRSPDDGPARAGHRRHRRRVRLRPRRGAGQMQAAVRRARPATFEGGADPEAATAMKIANNFVLGCAMEAMGEGFALTRKYGVDTSVFYDVMTDGLFNCSAYKVYGKIMVDESYSQGRPDGRARPEGRQPRARSRPPRRACRCRAATSGATGWSARSPTATATRTGR